jgi:SRSO17 transposase
MSCGAGAKGPRLYDFAEIGTASPAHRLIVRRNISTAELGYFWVHAPAETILADLVRVIGMRWMVEECFQAAKGQVGLDHYQVRSYRGWYRHVTLALAAHSWLTVTAVLAGQKGNPRRPPLAHHPTPYQRPRWTEPG